MSADRWSRFLSICLVLACLTLLAGCVRTVYVIDTSSAPSSPATTYWAYGDSITAGAGLTAETQNYTYLLGRAKALTPITRSLSGLQACDIPETEILANGDSPGYQGNTVSTLLISTNDVDYRGSGPYEAIFNLCHQFTLSWLATPTSAKLMADSSAVTTTGPFHLELSALPIVITDAPGASLSFPFQRTSSGAVYFWYRIVDTSPGTSTVTLDGKVVATLTTATKPALSTANGATASLALLRIPAVSAGSHILVATQTSPGAKGMRILGIGFPPSTAATGSPRVLAGTTPLQLAGSGAPWDLDPSICLAYVADITANVALLAGDGLNIQLFDARKYMTGTANDMADAVHQNAQGHAEIYRALAEIY